MELLQTYGERLAAIMGPSERRRYGQILNRKRLPTRVSWGLHEIVKGGKLTMLGTELHAVL